MSFTKTFSSIFLAPTTIIVFVFSFIMLIAYVVLQGGMGVPIWLPVNLFVAVMMVGILYGYSWYNSSQYNPEGKYFIQARKSDVPLLAVITHSGFLRFKAGTKEKEGDIFYAFNQNSNEGVRIAPDVQSGAVPKTVGERGLQIYFYGTGSPFPMGSKEVIAYDHILKYVRERYPVLNVFDGATVLEYVSKDRNVLPHDCNNLAQMVSVNVEVPPKELDEFKVAISEKIKAEAEEKHITDRNAIAEAIEKAYNDNIKGYVIDYRARFLVSTFMKIQDETAKLPLPNNKFFSFAEGFMHSISAFTAFDYQTLMQLFEMIARKENEHDLKFLVGVCVAIAIVFIGGGLAYQMIGSARR